MSHYRFRITLQKADNLDIGRDGYPNWGSAMEIIDLIDLDYPDINYWNITLREIYDTIVTECGKTHLDNLKGAIE